MPWRRHHRFWRHLVTDRGAVRRAFPDAALERIEAAIAAGESDASRTGLLRDRAGAAARPRAGRAARRASARSRCSACCGSGTPRRTAACSSTCCSPIATSRSSPTAASTRASAARRGKRSAGRWRRRFASGAIAEGAEAGVAAINALLAHALPGRRSRAWQRAPEPPADPLTRRVRPAPAAAERVSARAPAGLSMPIRCSESPLRLVEAVAQHHQHHRAGDEEAEHHDRVVDREAPADHQRVEADHHQDADVLVEVLHGDRVAGAHQHVAAVLQQRVHRHDEETRRRRRRRPSARSRAAARVTKIIAITMRPIATPIGSTLTDSRSVTHPRRDHRADRDADGDDALQHRRLRQVEAERLAAQSITMNCSVAPAPQNSVVVASEIWPSLSRHSSADAVRELADQAQRVAVRPSRWSTPVSGMYQLNSAAMRVEDR